jgi:tetratricopeptide (TPR) repeat protein
VFTASVIFAEDHNAELTQHAKQAQAAIGANDAPLAKQELLAILKLDPANTSVLANLGMVEFSQGEYVEASGHFEAVLSKAPDLWNAQAFLGMCKLRLSSVEQGEKLLEEALPRVTDRTLHVQAGLELVKSYSELGMNEKAEAVLHDIKNVDPRNQEVLYTVYRLHSEMASAALRKLTAIDPNSAWVHEVLGQSLMAQEQYSQAIKEFQKAIERGPHLAGLRYQLGEALLSEARTEGNRVQAEREFLEELQTNPRDSVSLLKLAEIELDRANFDKAQSFVTRALAARPEFADAHALFGKLLLERRDIKGATAELETAERLAPETKTTHYQLSQLYRALGRSAESDREAATFKRLLAAERIAGEGTGSVDKRSEKR